MRILVINPNARDVALAVPPLLEQVKRANEEGYDAVIIACFSDPGLQAAREVSDILVLGIEETTLHVAAMLGHKFTILTPLAKRIPAKEREVRGYALPLPNASQPRNVRYGDTGWSRLWPQCARWISR